MFSRAPFFLFFFPALLLDDLLVVSNTMSFSKISMIMFVVIHCYRVVVILHDGRALSALLCLLLFIAIALS
jgi:hypothetical protein